MTIERNKAVIVALADALNRRDWEAVGACFAENVMHQSFAGSRALFLRTYADIRATFPDYVETIERLIAEEDWVVELKRVNGTHLARPETAHHGDLRGVEPAGKKFEVRQAHFWRLQDGLIVDHQVVRDDLGMHRQLGLAPSRP